MKKWITKKDCEGVEIVFNTIPSKITKFKNKKHFNFKLDYSIYLLDEKLSA